MRFRPIALALAFLLAAGAAHAQDTALDRVQNLINTGRLTEARNTLAQWERTNGDPASSASVADRARALFLTGVLSTDPQQAEDAFLNVVLSYPSSAVAPDALLRLGQGFFTAGENKRAITYLARLQSDYPPSTARETGILWLARAQLADGAAAEACGTARDNLAGTSNPNLRTLIEIERDRACSASGGEAVRVATPASNATATAAPAEPRGSSGFPADPQARPAGNDARTPARPALPDLGVAVDGEERDTAPRRPQSPNAAVPRPTNASADVPRNSERSPAAAEMQGQNDHVVNGAARAAADVNTGEFAVQTAAFSQKQAADRIAAELKSKGFDARIVTVPGSDLFRVRYGVYETRRDAAAAAMHVRDAGFATLIVSDVRLERRP